jgi:murein DD-endopeptidase MepM/ murein hydrolase activator NlpD
MHPIKNPRITQAYGVKNPRYAAGYHTGIDYGCRKNTKVMSITSGKVVKVYNDKNYGKTVIIRSKLNNKFYWNMYCHLERPLVKEGVRVVKGQVIALSGNTGNSTAPHLHLETRVRPYRYRDNVKNPFILDPRAFN